MPTRYKDPSLPISVRVEALLAQMTLDEKLAQIGSVWIYQLLENMEFSSTKAEALLSHGLGQITRAGGASNLLPEETADVNNAIQKFLMEETRLGIPAMDHEECCSGYMARGAMVYPQAIGIACTFEPQYARDMAELMRDEMRSIGAHQALAPVMDVTRDPRWGRTEETFGEDRRLVADMSVAYVRGLQGDGPDKGGIIATAKHFIGYGVTEGGMNWSPAHIPARELREVFCYPFERAIKDADLGSVMNAYHELDGMPCAADETILTDLLHDTLEFDGLVVSDYFAVDMILKHHQLASDKSEAAALGLKAGIDVELPGTDCYGEPLKNALEKGLITEDYVDRAVRRVLRAKFELGLFENPFVDVENVKRIFSRAEPKRLAVEIAEKSFVLLKNDAQTLPLSNNVKRIALIGPSADGPRNLVGDYAYPAHIDALLDPSTIGSDELVLPEGFEKLDYFAGIPGVLEAMKSLVGDRLEISYSPGCEVQGDDRSGFAEAVDTAREADVAVLVVGGRSGLIDDCTCGEARDSAQVKLPGVQEDLIRAVAATGTPVVLAIVGGRPFVLTDVVEHARAILHCWLPGQEGGRAIAKTLLGETVPSGKLPISMPRSSGQIPVFYGHKPSGGRSHWKGDYVDMSVKPLFAFGHGLSYTTFEYSDLTIDTAASRPEIAFSVSLNVKNTGPVAGDDVVQVYVHDQKASVTRPVKELVGYRRITIASGQTVNVTIDVPVEHLAYVGRDGEYIVEPGGYDIMVGAASDDIRLEGEVTVD
ncbi:glycoside hydrolase family 3 N-terminal domain-containing protein [Bacteroidota bacterium]